MKFDQLLHYTSLDHISYNLLIDYAHQQSLITTIFGLKQPVLDGSNLLELIIVVALSESLYLPPKRYTAGLVL